MSAVGGASIPGDDRRRTRECVGRGGWWPGYTGPPFYDKDYARCPCFVIAVVKRLSCHISQESCPFPTRFAEPAGEPGYAARGPGERPVGVESVADEHVSHETSSSRETRSTPPGSSLHPGTDAPSLVALLEMALDPEGWEAFSRGKGGVVRSRLLRGRCEGQRGTRGRDVEGRLREPGGWLVQPWSGPRIPGGLGDAVSCPRPLLVPCRPPMVGLHPSAGVSSRLCGLSPPPAHRDAPLPGGPAPPRDFPRRGAGRRPHGLGASHMGGARLP